MTTAQLYALCGVVLFAIGFHGVVTRAHQLRKLLSVNVMGSGVFLVLVALASRATGERPDPIPQAMVLTGIVVAISATAVALSLVRRVHEGEVGEYPGGDAREARP